MSAKAKSIQLLLSFMLVYVLNEEYKDSEIWLFGLIASKVNT